MFETFALFIFLNGQILLVDEMMSEDDCRARAYVVAEIIERENVEVNLVCVDSVRKTNT